MPKKGEPPNEAQRAALDKHRKMWQPGQSGNPQGRTGPNRQNEFARIVEAIYSKVNPDGGAIITEDMPFNIGGKQRVIDKVILGQAVKAAQGNTAAAQFIADGYFGKNAEKHEFPGGFPAVPVQIFDDIPDDDIPDDDPNGDEGDDEETIDE